MAKKKILSAEDEGPIRELLRITLDTVGGYELMSCASGDEALAAAAAYGPDLVILDALMPGRSGPETLRALRRYPAVAAVPVIFLTARTQAHAVEDYRALGARDVIAKPFDPMDLLARVAACLEQGTPPGTQPPPEILVVEDDPAIRYLLEAVLGQGAGRCAFAHDGAQARECLAGPVPRLVILDMNLPVADGITILCELRARAGWEHVPVLMLTARGEESVLERAFAGGATDYVVKPFDVDDLAERVRRLLKTPTSP
jgi:DNA-binding response OmpR family regulator